MASASSQLATRVCANCKARKKKCDKVLPCCSYCAEKGIKCLYQEQSNAVSHRQNAAKWAPYPSPAASTVSFTPTPFGLEATICREAQRNITAAGLYLDEVSVRYYESVHCYLPIISRERFHSQLISFGSNPQASFSILLLSMALLVYHTDQVLLNNGNSTITSLYFATKALHSQAQIPGTPSLDLVQAGILLAQYEYAQGEPQHAFFTIGNSARMAYAMGLRRPSSLPRVNSPDAEEAYTWWGIAISERLFLCELSLLDQPLLSVISDEVHASMDLPVDSGQTDALQPTYLVHGLRQAARATCLLDQLLGAISGAEDPSWATLEMLDKALQVFLGETIQEAQGMTMYCQGISIAIRALFLLHRRILDSATKPLDCPKEAESNSRAALDTVTKIVADVAETHQDFTPRQLDGLPRSYAYNVRAAVEYLQEECQPLLSNSWLRERELRLECELDRLKIGKRITE